MPKDGEIQVITVDKLDGGRVNFPDQTMIEPNVCASGSMNVWCPNKVLTKTPGLNLVASITASGATTTVEWIGTDDTTTAENIYYIVNAATTGFPNGNTYLFGSSYTITDSLTPLGYTAGTIAINGVSATGSGTLWGTASGSAGVRIFDRLQTNQNTNSWIQVLSVEDDTHLTLASAIPTSVGAGTSYMIQHSIAMSRSNFATGSLNSNLVFGSGAQYMVRYDQTNTYRMIASSTASTTPPGCQFMAAFQGYLFGASIQASGSNTAFPSRVVWSNLGDPTQWYVNNFIDIDISNNGFIAGLVAFGQELIVFKKRGMYKILGTTFDPTNPTYTVQRINTPSDFIFNSAGSCAIHTTVSPSITYGYSGVNYSNSILIFYAGNYIYAYQQGTSFITRLSDSILLDMPAAGSDNQNLQTAAISFNGYYILLGLVNPNLSDPSNAMGILMDRQNKFWMLHNTNGTGLGTPGTWPGDVFGGGGSSATASGNVWGAYASPTFAIAPSKTSRTQLLVSNTNVDLFTGRIYSWPIYGPTYTTSYPVADAVNTSSYTTGPINGVWQSKEFNINYGTFWKVVVYMKKQPAGSLNLSWTIDQGNVTASASLDMTTGRGTVIRSVTPINQKGSTIQLTLSNNVASQTFGIYALKIYYTQSDEERIA